MRPVALRRRVGCLYNERVWTDVGQEPSSDESEQDELGADSRVPFTLFVLMEAGLAPLALVLGWAFRQPPLADFAWNEDAAVIGVAAALPLLTFFAVAMRWPVGPLAKIKAFFDRELAPLLEGCDWPDLALLSLAAGVGEEMLFRGVIQGALARTLGRTAGIAIAAALFGLLHPVSATYIVVAGLLGAYLGLIWLLSGNLLAVIVAHTLYDFVALLVLMSDRSEAAESSTE
jgi:membrane protease YdiL (CAAX protease family)